MKRRLLVFAFLMVASVVGFYEYDIHVSYSYSTRTNIQVDLKAIGNPENVWYTTSDGVIEMCLSNDVWHLNNFAMMEHTSAGYLADVGASRAKSALLHRDLGTRFWRGKMLIIVEQNDQRCDVFLIDNVEQADSLVITAEQRIRQRMPTSRFLRNEKRRF